MAAVKYSDEIVTSLRQKIEQAIDAQSDKALQRRRAWQQFKCLPTGDEIEGRSAVQSSDVNSMITAACAQLAVSFNTDSVVSFTANSAKDEAGAKAESRAVNKVLMEDNQGFGKIIAGVQNALMYRNGYMKCWWDVDRQVVTTKHTDVEAVELPVLAEGEQGVERRLVSYDPDKKTARIEATYSQSRLAVEAVANERFFIDPDWEGVDLTGCPLAGEVHYKTRDELSRMGVDAKIVKALPATTKYSGAENQNTRTRHAGNVDPAVPQLEICRVYEAYARLAWDEDEDRAYLHKCWIGDRTDASSGWLMDPEPVSRMPYAAGSAFPIANQHEGEALSEKLYQVQSGKTQLFRQWIDNVQNCSFGRFGAVVGQVEAGDLLTPKAGGPIRIKSPTALVPIPVIDVGPSIKIALEEFDKARSERGGASLDMIGAEMQIASDSAHGTERVYAAKEILVSYMATNLAESMIHGLFLLAHAELRDGDGGPINLKIAEEWQTVDPRTWQPRSACNVNVAPSFGERMLQAQTLSMGLQLYGQAMSSGLDGIMVTAPGLYKMTCDWLRLNLVDDPEAYFIDPNSEQAQAAGQAKQQQQQQQMEMQAKILALPEQIKAQYEVYKADQKTTFDYFKAVLDAMQEANATETQGAIDVISAGTEAKAVQNSNRAGSGGAAPRANGNGSAGSRKPRAAAGRRGGANGSNRAATQGN